MTANARWQAAVLLLAGIVHLGGALLRTPAGHLSIDEVTYHLMTAALAAGDGLEVENGYRERPSPELAIASLVPARDRLVGMPPPVYPALVVPFHRLLGWRGAFLLNALAFCATLVCCWRLARSVASAEVAWNATLVLGLATFLPDYAQAGWPHATTTLLVTAALLAALGGRRDGTRAEDGAGGPERHRGRPAGALAAGLLVGAAAGVRLDAVFALPGLAVGLLVTARRPLPAVAALLAGAAPGLVLLSWLNHRKLGTWSPFDYGAAVEGPVSGAGAYVGAALLGALVLAALGAWLRAGAVPRKPALAVALLALATLLALPASRELLAATARGFAQLALDLRLRPLDIPEPVLERTASGAMVYLGGLKKSLLQSSPVLALAAVALLLDARRGGRRALLLVLPALGVLGVYSLFAWHGGMALSLRYWTPALPPLAILTALAIERLGVGRHAAPLAVGALGTAVALALRLWLVPGPPARLETTLLSVPLGLAAALVIASAAVAWRRRGAGPAASSGVVAGADGAPGRGGAPRAVLAGLVGAAFAWGAVVTHLYDMPWSARQRASTLAMRGEIAPLLPEGALLLTPYIVGAGPLAAGGRVLVADPTRDDFADAPDLVRHHLAAGRPVFALLPAAGWARWRQVAGPGPAARPVWSRGPVVLARIGPSGGEDLLPSGGEPPP